MLRLTSKRHPDSQHPRSRCRHRNNRHPVAADRRHCCRPSCRLRSHRCRRCRVLAERIRFADGAAGGDCCGVAAVQRDNSGAAGGDGQWTGVAADAGAVADAVAEIAVTRTMTAMGNRDALCRSTTLASPSLTWRLEMLSRPY